MRPGFRQVILCILLLPAGSCSNNGIRGFFSNPLPEAGMVHEKVPCRNDTAISYALYIPGTGSAGNLQGISKVQENSPPEGRSEHDPGLYPVMVIFDPHGNGSLPVTIYKGLSEKYGFILIGSNDSKNGIQSGEVNDIVDALILETQTVYPVDTNRVYLLGFSGGARVATIAGMYLVPAKGIIGCGAGFGNTRNPARYRFDYYGIAGTADFNMNEMQELEKPLTRAGIRHLITTFPGKHAWPPAEVMEEGFQWHTLNAMKDGILPVNDGFIGGIISSFNSLIAELQAGNRLIAAAETAARAISFLDGLAPTEGFKTKLAEIKSQPGFSVQSAYHLKTRKLEEKEKEELTGALQSQDLAWWKNRISLLTVKSIKKAENREQAEEDSLKDQRVLSFLSLYCYMNAATALSKQDQDAAARIISIYEMADPLNPEPNYMQAVLNSRRSDTAAALSRLQAAIGKGFSDSARLNRQPEFQSMRSMPEWTNLLNQIK